MKKKMKRHKGNEQETEKKSKQMNKHIKNKRKYIRK
jgi:hypothetical protein